MKSRTIAATPTARNNPGKPVKNQTAIPLKERSSKKKLLLLLALAATLSIGSVRWIVERKPIPVSPVNKTVTPTVTVVQTKVAAPVQEIVSQEKPRAEAPVKTVKVDAAKKFRKNWSHYITAVNSNYAYGVLGGINDLSVIFTNKTDYPIEEMAVKVVFIKNNGKPWKTKYISEFNIAPHSEKRQTVPQVNRGKSVQISISKIVSSKMHFYYNPEKVSKNADDPYFMQ